MRQPRARKHGAAALALLLALVLGLSNARAVSYTTLYVYSLKNPVNPVSNSAAPDSGTKLNLFGTWSPTNFGTLFIGDRSTKQSVAYAKPESGPTLYVGAAQAVGAGVIFKYRAPLGAACFSDSPNLTQVGRFGDPAQVKIQLSNCAKNANKVLIECRVAGAKSSDSDGVLAATQALVNDATYVVKCYKTPDPSTGNPTVTIRTVRLDPVNGNKVTVNNFLISPTGTITSYRHLSVANKYPLPPIRANTDQFVGEISTVAYCRAAAVSGVRACLDAALTEA